MKTGEEITGTPIYVKGKARWSNRKDWFVGFQEAFSALAKDKELTGETIRVWLHFLGFLGFENFIVVSQKDVAKELDLKASNVSRAIKILIKKKMLVTGPRVGRTYSYRLNMKQVWKGSAKAYNENAKRAEKVSSSDLAKERWNILDREK